MSSYWQHLPAKFSYLRSWAERFGLRGLTIYNSPEPVNRYASEADLSELRDAYKVIAERNEVQDICAWCYTIESGAPATEVREHVRGLLLLFERLAGYGIEPFIDGRVRYAYPEGSIVFDWARLPNHLQHWTPWLKRFQDLQTEMQLYEFVDAANEDERNLLLELKEKVARDGDALRNWCELNDVKSGPARNEAFQAGWLFLLEDMISWTRDGEGDLRPPNCN
jgi:hypothetical protein